MIIQKTRQNAGKKIEGTGREGGSGGGEKGPIIYTLGPNMSSLGFGSETEPPLPLPLPLSRPLLFPLPRPFPLHTSASSHVTLLSVLSLLSRE